MKKIVNLLLVLLLLTMVLSGCSKKNDTNETVSLESIAKLNDCEVTDLNVVYDEEGYLTFINGKLSENKITNEEEAYSFLKNEMNGLFETADVDFDFFSSYKSPNTNVTYYRFQQTLNADYLDNEDMPIEYLVNSIKLGVDDNGYPVVVSSDLDRSQVDYDTANIISIDDAKQIIKDSIENANVYDDQCGWLYWTDNSTENVGITESKKILAYMFYIDNPDYALDSTVAPYLAVVVSATAENNGIVTKLAAYELGEYSKDVENTSLKFFDDKKDCGTYTYTINFDWMDDNSYAITVENLGTDSLEVSVPVMFSETDGLYYLGEVEHYITVSNHYDFINSMGDINLLNCYVSDNPEDLNSWHFKNATDKTETITYFDDPNYVVGSFAKYYEIVEAFGTKFNMFEEYPNDSYMLTVYLTMGEYPTNPSLFMAGAANGGQQYDWNYFLTSPTESACLETMSMCHEFAHGVNNHFTISRYANEQGAVMEGFADMVGYQMAVTIDEKVKGWVAGGICSKVVRDFGNPNAYDQPQYINGLYYVESQDDFILTYGYLDYGGVHENSGIPNYLGYVLVNGETKDGEANLTNEEGLNTWFETLYISNYNTDFEDLGAYLKYAGHQLNLAEGKQAFIANSIDNLGLMSGKVDASLLEGAQYTPLTVNFTYEGGLKASDITMSIRIDGDVGVSFKNVDSDSITMKFQTQTKTLDYLYVCGHDTNDNIFTGMAIVHHPIDSAVTYHVHKLVVKDGETYTFGDDETVYAIVNGALGSKEVTSAEVGSIIVTVQKDSESGEYNMYFVAAE